MAGSDAKARAIEETADQEFVISRVFEAPQALVFEAWTEPKHMAHWWGPRSTTNPVCEMDVQDRLTVFLITVATWSDGTAAPPMKEDEK
jgi:hypothetical protein